MKEHQIIKIVAEGTELQNVAITLVVSVVPLYIVVQWKIPSVHLVINGELLPYICQWKSAFYTMIVIEDVSFYFGVSCEVLTYICAERMNVPICW